MSLAHEPVQSAGSNTLPTICFHMNVCAYMCAVCVYMCAVCVQGMERFYDTVMQGLLRHIKFEGEVVLPSECCLLAGVCECVSRLLL